MITVFIGWVVYCFLFIRVVFHGLRIGSFFLTVLILCALFLLLVFWSVRRLFRPSAHTRQAFAPAPSPAADDSGSIVFRVAGTTFDNDDGTSRQDLLRGFRYEDPEDLIVTFEETEYAGELAFAVLINDQQVGSSEVHDRQGCHSQGTHRHLLCFRRPDHRRRDRSGREPAFLRL